MGDSAAASAGAFASQAVLRRDEVDELSCERSRFHRVQPTDALVIRACTQGQCERIRFGRNRIRAWFHLIAAQRGNPCWQDLVAPCRNHLAIRIKQKLAGQRDVITKRRVLRCTRYDRYGHHSHPSGDGDSHARPSTDPQPHVAVRADIHRLRPRRWHTNMHLPQRVGAGKRSAAVAITRAGL